jgi:superfamily II DNA or RNA helicase/HKD family nuclease
MPTKFFTNKLENTLLNKIEGVFTHRNIHFFDALVGYFYASGYFKIRKYIEKTAEIRIIAGIAIDEHIQKAHKQGLIFAENYEQSQEDFFNDMKKNIQQASYDKEVEDGMFQLILDLVSQKIQIRVHPKKNIHAKMYVFREKEKHAHGYGVVITGSSNLTAAGLSTNFELNVELRDNEDIDFALDTFNELWLESVPIDESYITRLKDETYLNDSFTPYAVYMKFLIEYFGNNIDFDPNVLSDLPHGFKKLNYQADAVNEGYSKMMKHGGFFLADVVGLGKTIVACQIARQFFYKNGFPSHLSSFLVVTPPSMEKAWRETADKFGLKTCDFITNGSLHKVKNPEKYDLIIVDEAHKFRSDTAEMYDLLQKLCKTTTRKVNADGSKEQKKVILVSATPLNNRPEDIANQVYLFQDSKNADTMEISNLQHFFRLRIDEYKKAKHLKDIKAVREEVKKIYGIIRDKVIKPLTVRRTRTDLKDHDLYNNDLLAQGIIFPIVKKPEKIFYQLDEQLETVYDKTIHFLSHEHEGLTYNRYRAIQFLIPEKKKKYKAPDLISQQLAKIMKILLVKRIDSSFHAFRQSLQRFHNATKAMVTMFDTGRIYIAPKFNVSEYINDGREEELLDILTDLQDSDPTIEICSPEDFVSGFREGLEKDFHILADLLKDWNKVNNDPKLDTFKKYLDDCLLDKKFNPAQKLVIFSESKETTYYLTDELTKAGYKDIITVESATRRDKMPKISANFDANIPDKEKKDDYNILISTEVLAEGVNLHRANIIVNYDTPWNSTRLMQRIGRVNRIGSTSKEIHVFNFFPTAKVNNDIELEKKAIMKLQAFHAALGEDSQIYSPDEEFETFGLFDKSPEDERDETLEYLMQVRKFKAESPELFKQIKNMPLRARVGRKNKTIKDSTICFIRNARRDAFFYCKADGEIEEYTFLDTVKHFFANQSEKSFPLHDLHHEQVKKAIDFFVDKIEKEKAKDKKVDTTQGPNERKALDILAGLLNLPFLNDDDKNWISKAQHAVKTGRFQNLQREINKADKHLKSLNLAIKLEKMIEIIKEYPLQDEERNETVIKIQKMIGASLNPEIIISESFTV